VPSEQRTARVMERHTGSTRLCCVSQVDEVCGRVRRGRVPLSASCFKSACCLEVLRPHRKSSLVLHIVPPDLLILQTYQLIIPHQPVVRHFEPVMDFQGCSSLEQETRLKTAMACCRENA